MDFYLSKIVSELMLPPASIILLLILVIIAWKKYSKLARYTLIATTVIFFLLSFPLVSQTLVGMLEVYPALNDVEVKTTKAQAIVVLGGGRYEKAPEYGDDTVNARTLERVRYGVHLNRINGLPILVTGGAPINEGKPEAELMALVLVNEFDVTPKWVERNSRTTQENAQMSRDLLTKTDIKHVLLVTHAWHMIRAKQIFEQYGFIVTPAPTRFEGFRAGSIDILDFLPSAHALEKSYFALHELMGVVWYTLAY
jgi:uncharacterized SAM-binding protein YcdF (DUF218 family)